MTGHFSQESWEEVEGLLYAEGQPNPLEGKCGQKKLQEQAAQPRTAAQQSADQARAQANRGKDNIPSATRSEAARKGAETRKKCAGAQTPSAPATTTA